MDDELVGISFPMDRALHRRLKIGAALAGMSIKDYVIHMLDIILPNISNDGKTITIQSNFVSTMVHGPVFDEDDG